MSTINTHLSKTSYKILERALICMLRAIYPISLHCSFLSIALISMISNKLLKIHVHHFISKYELILAKLLCSIISCYEFLQIEYKRFHASGDRKSCGNISTFCITVYPSCKNQFKWEILTSYNLLPNIIQHVLCYMILCYSSILQYR